MLSDVGAWFDYLFRQPWETQVTFGLGIGAGVAGLSTGFMTLSVMLIRFRRDKRVGPPEPPWLAESLLCIFARAKDIEALMGDFEELFARDCESGVSSRRAVVRYWARVLRSIGPQVWQAFKRVGLFGLIAAALRRQ
jgi:hypothetical protein